MMIQRCYFINFLLWLSATAAFGTQSSPTTTAHRQPSTSVAARSRLFRLPTKLALSDTLKTATSVSGGYEIPSYPKSPDEYEFIKMALLDNVMFVGLPKETLDSLIYAFEATTAKNGDVIVTQGDHCEGDYVYLVGNGDCTVLVDGKVVPEPYGTLKPKAIFGELGVLYDDTRKATVTAKTDTVTLYRVNGDTLKSILNRSITSSDDAELLGTIDHAINQVSGTTSLYGGDIIRPYKSPRSWLWARWKGTVVQHNYKNVLGNMLVSLIFIFGVRYFTEPSWKLGLVPDKSHPFIQWLDIIRRMWSLQMSL
jgi:hypothetical protein